jgi:hypothetical protein
MSRPIMSYFQVNGKPRKDVSDFIEHHILVAPQGLKVFAAQAGNPDSSIGTVDYVDDDSDGEFGAWSVTLNTSFESVETLVAMSAEYPSLNFWLQLADVEDKDLTPKGFAPDFSFEAGRITSTNGGDFLA